VNAIGKIQERRTAEHAKSVRWSIPGSPEMRARAKAVPPPALLPSLAARPNRAALEMHIHLTGIRGMRFASLPTRRTTLMGRALILWLLGVPASLLIILWLIGVFH
jgi:hypothetical protein